MRSLTLHQLHDIISEVFASKAMSDARCVSTGIKLSSLWHRG